VTIQTTIAVLAMAGDKRTCPHVLRSLFALPVQNDTMVENIDAQVNLEIRPVSIFVFVFLPTLLSNSFTSTIDNNNI